MLPSGPPPQATYDVIAAEARRMQVSFAQLSDSMSEVLVRIDASAERGEPPSRRLIDQWKRLDARIKADHARYIDLLAQARALTTELMAWADRTATDRERDLAMKLSAAWTITEAAHAVAESTKRDLAQTTRALAEVRDEYEPDADPNRPMIFSNLRHVWRTLTHGA